MHLRVGGSAPTFGSIAVAGQATVVADAAADTLTLVGANGLVLTTDPATDTLTLAPIYGSGANTVCEGNDARLSDARTPTPHMHGAADDLTDVGDFYAKARGTSLSDTTGTTACAGNDARLSDSRHADVARHQPQGRRRRRRSSSTSWRRRPT